jgi:hypothetical protein
VLSSWSELALKKAGCYNAGQLQAFGSFCMQLFLSILQPSPDTAKQALTRAKQMTPSRLGLSVSKIEKKTSFLYKYPVLNIFI